MVKSGDIAVSFSIDSRASWGLQRDSSALLALTKGTVLIILNKQKKCTVPDPKITVPLYILAGWERLWRQGVFGHFGNIWIFVVLEWQVNDLWMITNPFVNYTYNLLNYSIYFMHKLSCLSLVIYQYGIIFWIFLNKSLPVELVGICSWWSPMSALLCRTGLISEKNSCSSL